MISLNPIYYGRKYLKGYLRLENNDFFGVDILNIRCIFNTNNTLLSKIKFNYILNSLKELPNYILNQLVRYNVKIIFIDDNKMFHLINEQNILGIYKNNGFNQVIYINGNQPLYSLKNSLYHEIGHFIDKCIGDTLNKDSLNSFTDDTLKGYLLTEINYLSDIYFSRDIQEVFAQIFAEIMQDNKDLISFAPKSCKYILEQINLLK